MLLFRFSTREKKEGRKRGNEKGKRGKRRAIGCFDRCWTVLMRRHSSRVKSRYFGKNGGNSGLSKGAATIKRDGDKFPNSGWHTSYDRNSYSTMWNWNSWNELVFHGVSLHGVAPRRHRLELRSSLRSRELPIFCEYLNVSRRTSSLAWNMQFFVSARNVNLEDCCSVMVVFYRTNSCIDTYNLRAELNTHFFYKSWE